MVKACGGNWNHVKNREYELIYLFHSSSSDFHEHWDELNNSNIPFWKDKRERLKGKKLRGLAIILDDFNKCHPYAFFGVVEKEEEKGKER